MPRWTDDQIVRLKQRLKECGQDLWLEEVTGWVDPVPPCVDDTAMAMSELGILGSGTTTVAGVVFAVAASDPSTAPRPPTAHRDPMSPGSLQTADYDMVSDPEAQPAAASDEPSSFGDEEPVGPLTFDAVVASVQAASTGAGRVAAKKIVAVMGPTGAGKSTFTHYLHGDELTIVTEPSGRRCIDVTTGRSRVGHDTSFTTEAETRSLGDDTTTVDLPGGFDTKGARAQLRNGVLNALVLTGAKEVRLVLVLPLDTIRTDRGGETLMRSLRDMERLFADVPEALKGVRVVISGACRHRNLEQYQTLSQSDLVEEALHAVQTAVKTAQDSGATGGIQLLKHINSGLQHTQRLSQRVGRAFGPCVVFNPLDAASRAAVVEAIVGGAPVRGLPGAPAFRPSLPVGVTADIDAMLRSELQQYTEEVGRRTTRDLEAAAGRLVAVTGVVAVMGRVGFLPQHEGLPRQMAEAASQENEKEKVALLQCVKEGNVTGLLGALERLDLLTTALWAAVEPVSPRTRWTNRVSALAICASELSSTLGGVNVSVTDARLVLREASPSLAVASGIDDVACSAIAEEFVSRLVAALTRAISVLKDVRRPFALAAGFQDIVKSTEVWAAILPEKQACDICVAARKILMDTTKATMDCAQIAAHDTGNFADGAEESLALLNDFARCTELLSIVGTALDVGSTHRTVIMMMETAATFTEHATAAEVNSAAERVAALVHSLDGQEKLACLGRRNHLRGVLQGVARKKKDALLNTLEDNRAARKAMAQELRMASQVQSDSGATFQRPLSDALQQSNPVSDLCALIPADGHLGCAIVSQALQECAELIKRALQITTAALKDDEASPEAQAAVLHLPAIAEAPYTTLVGIDIDKVPGTVEKAMDDIKAATEEASRRRDEFVSSCVSRLRARLPTLQQVEDEAYPADMVRAFDDTFTTLRFFRAAGCCDPTGTEVQLRKTCDAVSASIAAVLSQDPLALSAAKTITGRVLPLLGSAAFEQHNLHAHIADWATQAAQAVNMARSRQIEDLQALEKHLRYTVPGRTLCSRQPTCEGLLGEIDRKIATFTKHNEARIKQVSTAVTTVGYNAFSNALRLVSDLPDTLQPEGSDIVVDAALSRIHMVERAVEDGTTSELTRDDRICFDGLRDVVLTRSPILVPILAEWERLFELMNAETPVLHGRLTKALQQCHQVQSLDMWSRWSSLEALRDPVHSRDVTLETVALDALQGVLGEGLGADMTSMQQWAKFLVRWSDDMQEIDRRCPGVRQWLTTNLTEAGEPLIVTLNDGSLTTDAERRGVACTNLGALIGVMKSTSSLQPTVQAMIVTHEKLASFEQEISDMVAEALKRSDLVDAVGHMCLLTADRQLDAANTIGAHVLKTARKDNCDVSDVRCLLHFVSSVEKQSLMSTNVVENTTPLMQRSVKFGQAFKCSQERIVSERPQLAESVRKTVQRCVVKLRDTAMSSDAWRDVVTACEECVELQQGELQDELKEAVGGYVKIIKQYVAALDEALKARDLGCLNLGSIAKALQHLPCVPEEKLRNWFGLTFKPSSVTSALVTSLEQCGAAAAGVECVALLDAGAVHDAAKRIAFWDALRMGLGRELPGIPEHLEIDVVRWAEEHLARAMQALEGSDFAKFNKNYLGVSNFEEAVKQKNLVSLAGQLEAVVGPLRSNYEKHIDEQATMTSRLRDTKAICERMVVLREMAIDAPVLHVCVTRALNSVFQRLSAWSEFSTLIEAIFAQTDSNTVFSLLVSENDEFFRAARCKEWNARAGEFSLVDVIRTFECDPPLNKTQFTDVAEQFTKQLEADLTQCFIHATLDDVRNAAADNVRTAVTRCRGTLTVARVRELLRAVCVALSAVMASSRNPTERLRLHGVQIVTLLRILNLEKQSGECSEESCAQQTLQELLERIPNHMAQVLTGEGKSFTLGVLAAVLALLGAEVDVVCYSRYLTERDARALAPLFDLVDVAANVHYATIDDLCRKHFEHVPNTARHVLDTGAFPPPRHSAKAEAVSRVLLVDEVDVLFSRRFFGATFDAGFLLTGPEIVALLREIYDHRGQQSYDVLASPLFVAVKARYPGTETMLAFVAKQLVRNSTQYNKKPASDYQWIPERKKIGYKLKHGDDYDTGVVYPNMTQFAYLQLVAETKMSLRDASQHLGFHLNCGHLSYADIPASNYQLVVGVTGTLKQVATAISAPHGVSAGQWILTEEERAYLKTIYKVESFSFIPSVYGGSNNQFDRVAIWPVADEWVRKIETDIAHATRDGAALVFFKNRRMLMAFRALSRAYKNIDEVTEETAAATRQGYIANATQKSKVTAFTRAFVRGVDFQCRHGVLVRVIATYLPSAASEEVQMFGRTARQGTRGAVSMVLCEKHLQDKFGLEALPSEKDAQAKLLRDLRTAKMKKKTGDRSKRLEAARAAEKASATVVNALRSGQDPVSACSAICQATMSSHRPTDEAFVLVLDASGSMGLYWNALIAATSGVQDQLKQQGRGAARFIVVLFACKAVVAQHATAATAAPLTPNGKNRDLGTTTDYVSAFATAHEQIRTLRDHQVTLLFMTDGVPNAGFVANSHVGPLLAEEREHLAAFHIVSFCRDPSNIPHALSDMKHEADTNKVPCVSSNAVNGVKLQECFAAVTTSRPMHV